MSSVWCGRQDLNLQGCPPDSKSGASASSATPAWPFQCTTFCRKRQPFTKKKAAEKPPFPPLSRYSTDCICSTAHTGGYSIPHRSRRKRRRDGRIRSSFSRSRSSTANANPHSTAKNALCGSHLRFHKRRSRKRGSAHIRNRSRGHSRSRTAVNRANTYVFVPFCK